MRISEFFQEKDGKMSSKRLFVFLIVLSFCFSYCYITVINKIIPNPDWKLLTFIGVAIGITTINEVAKLMQTAKKEDK